MRRGPFVCLSVTARAAFCLFAALLTAGSAALFSPAGAAEPDGLLPVIMYHSVLRDPDRAGSYVVSPDTVEADFRFLREKGYRSLTAREAAALAAAGKEFPEKSVMITFDDGFLNNLTYVLPLLEKYDFKAVIAVVGSYSEQYSDTPDPNPAYAYLNWEEICAAASSGRVEIANHSYAMHREWPRKGSSRLRKESAEAYADAFRRDVSRTQELLCEPCGIIPTTYAYPFGSIGEGSGALLSEMGFTAALTCTEQLNACEQTEDGLLLLGRFNRPSGISTEKFMKKLGICS